MKSHWFQARKTLLFNQGGLPEKAAQSTEELFAIQLLPEQVEAAYGGGAAADAACAQPQVLYRDWNREGSWVRFNVAGTVQPGRYTLLFQYVSANQGMAPELETAVTSGGRTQSNGPVILPRTRQFPASTFLAGGRGFGTHTVYVSGVRSQMPAKESAQVGSPRCRVVW